MNVLFLVQPGDLTRHILLDMAHGAEQLGHRVLTLETAPLQRLYARQPALTPALMADVSELVAAFIRSNRIDVSIAMWANGPSLLSNTEINGRLVSFFEAIQSPHVLYWLDAPHKAHELTLRPHLRSTVFQSRWLFHVINNAGVAREMREIYGWPNVLALPYGVNPDVFRPYEDVQPEFDIVFCGGGNGAGDTQPTAAMLEEVRRDEPDLLRIRHELAEALIPRFEALTDRVERSLQAPLRQVLARMRQLQLTQRDVPPLDRLDAIAAEDAALLPAVAALRADHELFIDAAFALRSIEHWQRAFTVTYLARYFNVATFGAMDLRDWGCRATRLGPVAHADQARQYARGRLGLSVMRWEDEVSVHLKPFEITASGAACLCAWRSGIDELFADGTEIATFRSPPAARAATTALLSDDGRRVPLATAGRERSRGEHTWAARMRSVVNWLSNVLNEI